MAGLRHPRQQTTDRPTGSLALSAPAGPGGDVVDRLLVSVFFGQRYAAARRRLRHRSAACHQPRALVGFGLADAWGDDSGLAIRWSGRATVDPHLSRGGMPPAGREAYGCL